MEIYAGIDGIYAMPDIAEDFKNNKARRRYERELKRQKRELRRMNNSSRYEYIRANLRAKPEACPKCGSDDLSRWGIFWRKVRYFFHRFASRIAVPRFKCNVCGKTTSILPKFLTERRWYSDKALRDMVDMKLWTYAGYRKIGKWGRIHGCSHTMVIREIIKMASVSRTALKSIVCRFSSIVCIDEIYFRKVKGIHYMGIVAIDARYGRIIYENTYMVRSPKVVRRFGILKCLDFKESKTDCIAEFIDELLQIVEPKVIITDGNASYGDVIDEINKYRPKENRIKHFLCTLHVLWEIDRYFRGSMRIGIPATFERLKNRLHKVFNADTLDDANRLLDEILRDSYLVKGTRVEPLFVMLSDNRDRLFPFLKYGINRTNNPVEHYNGFAKRFQHVSRKFASLVGISSLLSVFALAYNFTPKMERDNKGITPLQKAGWNHKMDMYEFIDYPKCIRDVRAPRWEQAHRGAYIFKYRLPHLWLSW